MAGFGGPPRSRRAEALSLEVRDWMSGLLLHKFESADPYGWPSELQSGELLIELLQCLDPELAKRRGGPSKQSRARQNIATFRSALRDNLGICEEVLFTDGDLLPADGRHGPVPKPLLVVRCLHALCKVAYTRYRVRPPPMVSVEEAALQVPQPTEEEIDAAIRAVEGQCDGSDGVAAADLCLPQADAAPQAHVAQAAAPHLPVAAGDNLSDLSVRGTGDGDDVPPAALQEEVYDESDDDEQPAPQAADAARSANVAQSAAPAAAGDEQWAPPFTDGLPALRANESDGDDDRDDHVKWAAGWAQAADGPAAAALLDDNNGGDGDDDDGDDDEVAPQADAALANVAPAAAPAVAGDEQWAEPFTDGFGEPDNAGFGGDAAAGRLAQAADGPAADDDPDDRVKWLADGWAQAADGPAAAAPLDDNNGGDDDEPRPVVASAARAADSSGSSREEPGSPAVPSGAMLPLSAVDSAGSPAVPSGAMPPPPSSAVDSAGSPAGTPAPPSWAVSAGSPAVSSGAMPAPPWAVASAGSPAPQTSAAAHEPVPPPPPSYGPPPGGAAVQPARAGHPCPIHEAIKKHRDEARRLGHYLPGLVRLSQGRYVLMPQKKAIVVCLLRNTHLVVRFGAGWVDFSEYMSDVAARHQSPPPAPKAAGPCAPGRAPKRVDPSAAVQRPAPPAAAPRGTVPAAKAAPGRKAAPGQAVLKRKTAAGAQAKAPTAAAGAHGSQPCGRPDAGPARGIAPAAVAAPAKDTVHPKDTKAQPKKDAKAQPKKDTKAQPKKDAKAQPKKGAKAQPKAASDEKQKPKAKAKPKPKAVAKPKA